MFPSEVMRLLTRYSWPKLSQDGKRLAQPPCKRAVGEPILCGATRKRRPHAKLGGPPILDSAGQRIPSSDFSKYIYISHPCRSADARLGVADQSQRRSTPSERGAADPHKNGTPITAPAKRSDQDAGGRRPSGRSPSAVGGPRSRRRAARQRDRRALAGVERRRTLSGRACAPAVCVFSPASLHVPPRQHPLHHVNSDTGRRRCTRSSGAAGIKTRRAETR